MSRRRMEGACAGLFPAEAGPTDGPRAFSGTGFSREGVGRNTAEWKAHALASSRLKPVPLTDRVHLVGLALAGNASDVTPQNRWCLDCPLPG